MRGDELRARTRAFALAVVRLVERLPRTRTGDVVGRQLLRAGTSVAANYRAACRARSRREFVARMGIVEEEADETIFWLEMIDEAGLVAGASIAALRREAGQLVAITVASIRTARHAGNGPAARAANPQSAIRNPQSAPSAFPIQHSA